MNDKIIDKDMLALNAYIDGEMTPLQRAAFAARLQSEPALRARHDDYVRNDALFRALFSGAGESADDIAPGLLQALYAVPPARRQNTHHRWLAAAAVAGLCVLSAAGGWMLSDMRRPAPVVTAAAAVVEQETVAAAPVMKTGASPAILTTAADDMPIFPLPPVTETIHALPMPDNTPTEH